MSVQANVENNWLGVWGEALPRVKLSPTRAVLLEKAKQQALDLPMISSRQFLCTLQDMARKKPGLDAWMVQDLLLMPEAALSSLVYQLRQAEIKGKWPVQIQHVAIAMLPKDELAARPIALTSVLYRRWNKCRKHLLAAWVKATQGITPWDHLTPGSEVEGVSQSRQLRAEVSVQLGLAHAVVLLSIVMILLIWSCWSRGGWVSNIPQCSFRWQSLFMKVLGILAQDLCCKPVLPGRGLLAGCPQAVTLARLFLQPILASLIKVDPRASVSTWVDDIGADLADADDGC